ncbi:putative Heat shock protein 70 family [Helianthus anomalus]
MTLSNIFSHILAADILAEILNRDSGQPLIADISVICVFEILATNGETHLGGEDFDQRIMDYFIKLMKKKHRKDISKDHRALGKLRREAERAKRALSSQHQVCVETESLFDGFLRAIDQSSIRRAEQ